MATYDNVPQKSPDLQDSILSIFNKEIERLNVTLNLARNMVLSDRKSSPRGFDAPPPPPSGYSLRDTILAASGCLTTINNFLPLLTIKKSN